MKCTENSKVKQLGIFTRADLAPDETILIEKTLLTAIADFDNSFCDACGISLQSWTNNTKADKIEINSLIPCPECEEALFCSQSCYDEAIAKYHPALCGNGVELTAKRSSTAEASNSLYGLLLLRSFALASCQDLHPLDLPETKYIWGDYKMSQAHTLGEQPDPRSALPFSFQMNILTPLHTLMKMGINIFQSFGQFDTWVVNTLFAKFRGTASARQGTDGKPEVGAVHPLWCLANHSCDPNVWWDWGGSMTLTVRKERVAWKGKSGTSEPGIREGQEVLSHYCDVDLPVQERREWAFGALGGVCICERCNWEAS